MSTLFARSDDGTQIAYDRTGDGVPLVLLHGGFVQNRHAWYAGGYVERLREGFSVIAIDLRGHGESSRPTGTEAYGANKMIGDVLAVLDAEHVDRAAVWGYSLGASVALQLATASSRMSAAVLGGAALGSWLTQEAASKMTRMLAIASDAKGRGRLDELPGPQRSFAEKADLPVAIDTYSAIPSWPVVEPEALKCETLFYSGSKNTASLASINAYESRLHRVGARRVVLDGLDHEGEFDAVDQAVTLCLDFLRKLQ